MKIKLKVYKGLQINNLNNNIKPFLYVSANRLGSRENRYDAFLQTDVFYYPCWDTISLFDYLTYDKEYPSQLWDFAYNVLKFYE